MPAGEVEGETLVCGQIEVPQNWDEPDGTTITLTYAVMHSPSQAPFVDPVLFFHGGPGESTYFRMRGLQSPSVVYAPDVERYKTQQALNTEKIATYNAGFKL